MEEEIDFFELQRGIAERTAAVDLADLDAELFRNNELRRTEEKRALLGRMAERCQQAGVEPLKANY